jgi:hypothetical protein
MSCRVRYNNEINEVEGLVNGEVSALFKSIREHVPEGYMDMHVEAALMMERVKRDGVTGQVPKDQLAMVLWNKWYTDPSIKKKLEGKERVLYDMNGEPAFFEVQEELMKGGVIAEPGTYIGTEALIRFLWQHKLVEKKGKQLVLAEELSLPIDGMYEENLSAEEVNKKRIEKVLDWFGISKDAVSFKSNGKRVAVSFKQRAVKVEEPDRVDKTNTGTLIDFLRERFPQLKIQYVSEREARAMYQEYEQKMTGDKRGRLDFDRVNSFTHNGVVYLIEGRVTDQVAAEEAMHPFVYTISKNNTALFQNLLAAAKKDFPQLHKEIEELYSDKAGFTNEDRDLELVTQALGRTFTKEYETQTPRSVMELLHDVLQWFAQLVNDFAVFIGAKKVTINVASLPADATLTSLAQLLNTHDSQFLVDTRAPGFNFSLSTEKQALLTKLKRKCTTPLQEKILEDLFAMDNKVRLDRDTHKYSDEPGNPYTGMTTGIGGKFDDDEGRYLRNRLFGNDFDLILDSIVQGKSFKQIKDKITALRPDLAAQAYHQLQNYVYALMQDGSVLVPQIKVCDPDPASRVAGTLDLLLIRPDGSMTVIDLKVSKNSIKGHDYNYSPYPTKEGSRLPGQLLTTRQKHGIQVGGYKRLLEVNGYFPEQTVTYHIKVEIDTSTGQQEVKEFRAEGPVDHVPSAYLNYVEKIIPTRPAKETKIRQFLRELGDLPSDGADAAEEGDEMYNRSQVLAETLEQMRAGMEEFREKVRRRIDRMKLVKTAVSFNSPENRSLHKLSQLVVMMGQDLSRGQTQQAYGAFLRHAKAELKDLMDYMSDPLNKEKEEYIEKVLEASGYLETYRGMSQATEWSLGNKRHDEMLKDLLRDLNATQNKIRSSLQDYVLDVMMETTSKKQITREEWKAMLKKGTDISNWDFYLGDIDSSTDPIVAVAAKIYKRSKMAADDRAKEADMLLYDWGARLMKFFGRIPDLSKDIYELDENGKPTGRYVQKIGSQFWKRLEEIRSKIVDADGKMKQYRKVYLGDEEKNADDIAYNKQLNEDKKAWREFNQAEQHRESGPVDGDFFKYNEEFKQERLKFEEYEKVYDVDGKFLYGRWVKRTDVDISFEDYLAYKNKYYNFSENYDKPHFVDGVFTGELLRGAGNSWIPKQEYVEIREVAEDGTDMRSEQWMKLNFPTNERDKLVGEFYNFFVGELKERLKLLPASAQEEMYGRIPLQRENFINMIKKDGSALFKVMARNTGDWFTAHTITKAAVYDEDGTLMQQLPVFYNGSLRDQKAIEEIKQEQKALKESWKEKKISKAKYMDEKSKLRDKLRAAESKMDASEVALNPLDALGKFNKKVFEYDEYNRIKSTMMAVQEILDQRKYQKRSTKGDWIMEKIGGKTQPLEVAGHLSNTSKRFKAWMDTVFYGSKSVDVSMGDVYAKRFMNLTSLINVGFNFFGSVHNYLMNRITYWFEVWGGLYFDRSAGMRAEWEFNKNYLPNAVKKMFRSLFQSDKGYYHFEPPESKYEAVCRLFKIPRGTAGEDQKANVSALLAFGYKLSEWAEFSTQSKVAIAYLMTKKIKSIDGQQEMSIYDALEWKPGDAEPKLKAGFAWPSDTERHDHTNRIWETNKRMFGNYAWEDQMLIERYTLGKMVAQFHKWVYPLGRVRLHRYYEDENLGEQEGRLRSALEFVGFLRRAEGELKTHASGAWGNLSEVQVKNMYRNAAELVFLTLSGCMSLLLKGLSEGLGDEDERIKKLVNYLRYQNSRQIQEVKFWVPVLGIPDEVELIKNPFAMAGSFKQYADVVKQTLNIALPPYDDTIYYQSGVHKGKLKLGKELSDLTPILKDMNKWASFGSVTDFYIQ